VFEIADSEMKWRDGVQGFDVSHWQRGVIFGEAKESGRKFAIIKATEGVGYVDPWFERNFDAAREAGVIRGAYHFARVSKSQRMTISEDAKQEADHFCKTVLDAGFDDNDLPPTLDIEWDKRAKGVKSREIITWCKVFLARVEELTGRIPIVYTGKNYWRYKLAKTNELRRYYLWQVDIHHRKAPVEIPGWPACIWQYTFKVNIPGVGSKRGDDNDVFRGTEDDLRRMIRESNTKQFEDTDPAPLRPPPTLDPDETPAEWLRDFMSWMNEYWAGEPHRAGRNA